MVKYYTGVGTRDAPPDMFELVLWLGIEDINLGEYDTKEKLLKLLERL